MSKLSVILSGAVVALALVSGALAQTAQTGSGPPQNASVGPKSGTSEEVIIAPEAKRATSPDGDPRSTGQIHEDQQAWDRCILNADHADMTHPADSSPDEVCARRLGMRDRNAIPDSVKQPGTKHVTP